MLRAPSAISTPQLVSGSSTPRPRKEKKLSSRITRGASSVRTAMTAARNWAGCGADQIAARAIAQRPRGRDKLPLLQAQRLAAHDARHVEPFDRADGDEDQHEIAAEDDHEQDDEEDEGQRVEDVDEAHHRLSIAPPAKPATAP